MRIRFLQSLLSFVSSSFARISLISSFAQPSHLLFGLPFLLCSIVIWLALCPAYVSFLRTTCYSHRNLISLSLSLISLAPMASLWYHFFILSSLVLPNEKRSILNSATFILSSCKFVTATVYIPYIIAGRTMLMHSLSCSLSGTFLSHNMPVIFDQAFQSAFIQFATSLLDLPSLCMVDPRYLDSCIFFSFCPCSFTSFYWILYSNAQIFRFLRTNFHSAIFHCTSPHFSLPSTSLFILPQCTT